MRELPAVRELASQLETANFNIVLLNIHEAPGSDLLDDFDFRASPTYLIFDYSGEEVARQNRIPTVDAILELVA